MVTMLPDRIVKHDLGVAKYTSNQSEASNSADGLIEFDDQDGKTFFRLRQTFELTNPDQHNFEIMVKDLKAVDLKSVYDPHAKSSKDELNEPFQESKLMKMRIRWFETDNSILHDAFKVDRFVSEENLVSQGWSEVSQINDHFNEPLQNGKMAKYLSNRECVIDDDVNHSDKQNHFQCKNLKLLRDCAKMRKMY